MNDSGWKTILVDWYHELGNSPQTLMWGFIILLTALVTVMLMRIRGQQRNLELSEKRRDELFSMLEIFPEPVAILKESFDMVYGNQRLTNLVGWSAKELRNLKHRDYTPDKYALEDEAQSKAYAMSGKLGPYQKHFLTRDGARVHVEIRGQQVSYLGKIHILAEIRSVESIKYKNLQAEDKEKKKVLDRQFDFLSNLAGGVAHDLNNTLGPLMAYPDMMLERLPEDSDLRADLNEMKVAALKTSYIVKDLDAIAGDAEASLEDIDLNGIIDDLLRSPEYKALQARHPGVVVIQEKAQDLRCVTGNIDHMTQILYNLLSTCFAAMGREGQINITTATYYVEPRPGEHQESDEAGDFAVVQIKDNSRGVTVPYEGALFEPFFLRRNANIRGSGLALVSAYNLARRCRSDLEANTATGKGFDFIIRARMTESVPQAQLGELADLSGTESILVVDDVWEQRHLAGSLLSGLGYMVKTVETGVAAVNYVRQQKVDLVLLDMHLEVGLDGLDVYKQILQHKPDQKVIIVSGYAENDRVREALTLGVRCTLRKPYSLNRLGRIIREVLSGEEAGAQD